MNARALWNLPFALAVLACRAPGDQRTDAVTAEEARAVRAALPAAFIAQIDSGNTAIRERSYDKALMHYRHAVRIDSTRAAGWFGVYMAERRRGNAEAASAALRRARQVEPGASLLDPTEAGPPR